MSETPFQPRPYFVSADAPESPSPIAGKADEMPEELAKSLGIHDPSPAQMIAIGLIQAERIVKTAIGYHFADIVVPFDDAFKTLALNAISAVRGLADDRERLLARVAELERQLAIVNALAGQPAPYVHTVTTSGTLPEDTNASR